MVVSNALWHVLSNGILCHPFCSLSANVPVVTAGVEAILVNVIYESILLGGASTIARQGKLGAFLVLDCPLSMRLNA